MTKAFYVISYDIADDARRLRVARVLEGYGERVQRSVFECYLDERQLARLKRQVGKAIRPEEDSVRFYRLCEGCRRRVEILGLGQVAPPPDVYIF